MSKQQGQIAFVASTLPFGLIVKYHKFLGITRVVCASEALGSSYRKGFARLGIIFDIEVIVGKRLSRIFQLIRNLTKAQKAVIFHECCWWELDWLIIFTNTETLYFPQVTLVSRRKVSIREMPAHARMLALLKSKWFDFYETQDDGGGVYYVPVLKKCYRHEESILPSLQVLEPYDVAVKNENQIQRVLILSGTDVVPDHMLKDLYSLMATRFLSKGVEVHIKDHPNPAGRLNWSWEGAQSIDSELPLECLNLQDYQAIIGVASTGLASGLREGIAAISIISLLPSQYSEDLEKRLAHLNALHAYPLLPQSMGELVNLVSEI